MKAWEADLHDCIDRYNAFLDQLEPYPEWRTKIIDETGKWFLMIHNNLGESQTKLDIFAKLVRSNLLRIGKNILCDSVPQLSIPI